MALLTALGPKGSYVFSSDQRIALPAGRYVYPDLSAACGGIVLEVGTTDVITNPNIVVEVLSASTEPYDRGLKWEGYQEFRRSRTTCWFRNPSPESSTSDGSRTARGSTARSVRETAWF
jgi:Uma2 family endonuclease